MKKIINGKMYNTETAEVVASAGGGYAYNDFYWWSETIYRKKTGEFFMYGEGGAMSKYSHRCGDARSGGKEIYPVDEDYVRKWLEANCSADVYIGIFGEPEE